MFEHDKYVEHKYVCRSSYECISHLRKRGFYLKLLNYCGINRKTIIFYEFIIQYP